MTYCLGIDTSTDRLSLSLFQAESKHLVASLALDGKKRHGQTLLKAIQQLLALAGLEAKEIETLVVGAGPGSYTGLRIGMTAAKVWASSLQRPLYVISSLALLAGGATTPYIIPIMDARRGSAYTALYQYVDGHLKCVIEDTHEDFRSFIQRVKADLQGEVTLIGQGLEHFVAIFEEECPDHSYQVKEDEEAYPNTAYLLRETYRNLPVEVSQIDLLSPNYAQQTLAEVEWAEKAGHKGWDDETFIEHIM